MTGRLVAAFAGAVLLFALPAASSAQGVCGNGVFEAGEECEDGNLSNGDCCSSSCRLLSCTPAASTAGFWEDLGPRSLGGRVSALASAPSDRQRVYAGTPAAGVWRSNDGGLNWIPVAPFLNVTSISALAVDPTRADTVLAGTGAINEVGIFSAGIGVLRSTDGGASWTLSAGGGKGPYVASLLVWTEEPSRVLAATGDGVQLSTDGGATFGRALGAEPFFTLVRDPFDASAVFASGRTGLFRTPDRGASWSRVSHWPLLDSDVYGTGVTSVVASHQTPGLLYAIVQVLTANFTRTDRVMVLRSTDAGATWTPLDTIPPFCEGETSCGFGQALAIDPADERRLLLGGDRLFVSRDAGASWTSLGDESREVHEITLGMAGTGGGSRPDELNGRSRPDERSASALRVDLSEIPEVTVGLGGLIAAGSGVASLDASWSTLSSRNQGLAIASVTSLDASPESPPRLLAGTTDSGALLSAPGAAAWTSVFGRGEPTGAARFDPFAPQRLFASKTKGRLFRSNDAGASFQPILQGLDLNQEVADLAPFEPSPLVPGKLFTGRRDLYESVDSGNTWTPSLVGGTSHLGLIAPSPLHPDRVYFSLASGASAYLAAGNGATSLLTIDPDDDTSAVTSLFASPSDDTKVLATLNPPGKFQGRSFRSETFGEDWDEITPRDGMSPTSSIVRDATGAIYVGTRSGVLRSANDGFTWSSFNQALLAAGVTSLKIADGHLYAGTNGRGIFRTPVENLVVIDGFTPGSSFLVDGTLVKGPYYTRWTPGSQHTIAPYLLQTAETQSRFDVWSDGGAAAHTVTAGNKSWYTGFVRESHRLQAQVDPPGAGTVVIDPEVASGFYERGSTVSVLAAPGRSYKFTGFTGPLYATLDNLGLVLVEGPRTVVAHFEPLLTDFRTDPPGLAVSLDGQSGVAPWVRQWEIGSEHVMSVPATVDLDPTEPSLLVFDSWSDFGDREHSMLITRDTFAPSITARYVKTYPTLSVPPGAARSLSGVGKDDAARFAGLTVTPQGAAGLQLLQIVRGSMGGQTTGDLALTPALDRLETHAFIAGGGSRGRVRLAISNPGIQPASITLLLRDAAGAGLVGLPNALTVAAGGSVVRFLDEVLLVGPAYEGLLTVISSQPVALAVQSVRKNLRPSTFIDPVLLAPFTDANLGVPSSTPLQVLLRTRDTQYEVALLNPQAVAVAGGLALQDDDGAALAPTDISLPARYALAPFGHLVLRFSLPPPSGDRVTAARLKLSPDPGQSAPRVQSAETRTLPGPPAQSFLPRTLPPSRPLRQFQLPVDAPRRDTGFVLTNTGGSAILVTFALRDLEGGTTQTANLSVPAGRQIAVLTGDLFPSRPSSFRGLLVGSAGEAVNVVGFFRSVNGRGEEVLAGVPALDGGAAEVPVARYFPAGVDGDSWTSEWWLVNSAATTGNTRLDFRGEGGEARPLPMQ